MAWLGTMLGIMSGVASIFGVNTAGSKTSLKSIIANEQCTRVIKLTDSLSIAFYRDNSSPYTQYYRKIINGIPSTEYSTSDGGTTSVPLVAARLSDTSCIYCWTTSGTLYYNVISGLDGTPSVDYNSTASSYSLGNNPQHNLVGLSSDDAAIFINDSSLAKLIVFEDLSTSPAIASTNTIYSGEAAHSYLIALSSTKIVAFYNGLPSVGYFKVIDNVTTTPSIGTQYTFSGSDSINFGSRGLMDCCTLDSTNALVAWNYNSGNVVKAALVSSLDGTPSVSGTTTITNAGDGSAISLTQFSKDDVLITYYDSGTNNIKGTMLNDVQSSITQDTEFTIDSAALGGAAGSVIKILDTSGICVFKDNTSGSGTDGNPSIRLLSYS
ncbi:MAG: hypothetical protein AMJ43_07760 [Coxiella sp. DG_40]|nr:MAG: hypothetical protein AMJ43_07760 [Coxiella sp. DG_40]